MITAKVENPNLWMGFIKGFVRLSEFIKADDLNRSTF